MRLLTSTFAANKFVRITVRCALLGAVLGLVRTPGSGRAIAADKPPSALQAIQPAAVNIGRTIDFERDIYPILEAKCMACHNVALAENGLNLEDIKHILKGGKRGPAVVPGKPEQSLVYVLSARGANPVMPPLPNKVDAAAITSRELGLIRQWILEGAAANASAAGKVIPWQPLPSHVHAIYSVALTNDGQYAAVGRANQVVLYHTVTGKQVAALSDPALVALQNNGQPIYSPGTSHRDFVHTLGFSPDGKMLASGSFREVKLWSRPDPVALQTLAASVGKTTALAVSRDDRWLALSAADHSLRLYDLKTGQVSKTLKGHAATVTGLQFTADGRKLCSSSLDRSIRLWNVETGLLAGRIDTPAPLNGVALNQDGSRLLAAGSDKILYTFSLPADVPREVSLPVVPEVAALSPDRKLAALAEKSGKITLHELPGMKVVRSLEGHTGGVRQVAFHAGGSRLASIGADDVVKIWDLATGALQQSLAGSTASLQAVAWNQYSPQIATGGSDGRVTLWKLDAAPPRSWAAGTQAATVVALSRDGKQLAADSQVNGQPAILIRDVASGQIVKTLAGQTGSVTALAFNSDGTRLISGSSDHSARVWNLADGKLAGSWTGSKQPLVAVAFSTSDATLAVAATATEIKLWKIGEGKEQPAKFEGNSGTLVKLLAVPGGQYLTISSDRTVRVWNASGARTANISLDTRITDLAVTADGARFAVCGADKPGWVFQLSGQPVAPLEGAKVGELKSVSFSPDGSRLITAGADGRARLWETQTGNLLETYPAITGLRSAVFAGTAQGIALLGSDKTPAVQAVHVERVIPPTAAKGITALQFAQPGNALFIAQESGQLRRVLLPTGQTLATQTHGGAIRVLALNADGTLLAAGDDKGQIKIWQTANLTPASKPVLAGAQAAVQSLSFLTDNQHLVAGTANQRSIVFSLKQGEPVQLCADHSAAVLAVGSLGDRGRQIVSIAAEQPARVWECVSQNQIGGHTAAITCVAGLASSGQAITGSEDGTLRTWDIYGGRQLRSFSQGAAVRQLAVRGDGLFAVSLGTNNLARLWNLSMGQPVAEWRGDQRTQSAFLALQNDDNEVKGLLAALKGQLPAAEKKGTEQAEALKKATVAKSAAEQKQKEALAKSKTATQEAEAAKKAADAKKGDAALVQAADKARKGVETATADLKKAEDELTKAADAHLQAEANVREASTAVNKLLAEQKSATARQQKIEPQLTAARAAAQAREKAFTSAAFSPDGKQFILGSELGSVSLFDGTTGAPLETFDAHAGGTLAVGFRAEGTVLSVGSDQQIRVWNLSPPWKLAGIIGPKPGAPLDLQESAFVGRVLCLDFSSDGKVLATGGGDPSRSGEILLWDVPERKLLRTLPDIHSDTVFGIEFSPDGTALLSGAADKFAKITDLQSGKVAKAFEGHTAHVLDVSWRHDGKRIASAGADNVIKVWNVETGEQERTIPGFTKQVTSLQYLGRGDTIVSSCGDRTVRFHVGSNGATSRNFSGANDFLYSVAGSADEKTVVSGGQDGILRIWNGANGQLLHSLAPPSAATAAVRSAQR